MRYRTEEQIKRDKQREERRLYSYQCHIDRAKVIEYINYYLYDKTGLLGEKIDMRIMQSYVIDKHRDLVANLKLNQLSPCLLICLQDLLLNKYNEISDIPKGYISTELDLNIAERLKGECLGAYVLLMYEEQRIKFNRENKEKQGGLKI